MDSVTTVYDSLEQLDPSSGYLRSAMRERRWDLGFRLGIYIIRTQLSGSIASLEPLIYKFKIKSEYRWSRSSNWDPYNRVFKVDAERVEELTNRLGIK